jgi:hypothetical protein
MMSHCSPAFSFFVLFLFKIAVNWFPHDISTYICIKAQIGSSPLFSSFYFSPLLIVISTGLKTLYSFLYREYINHIHHLNYILLYATSFVCDLPLM